MIVPGGPPADILSDFYQKGSRVVDRDEWCGTRLVSPMSGPLGVDSNQPPGRSRLLWDDLCALSELTKSPERQDKPHAELNDPVFVEGNANFTATGLEAMPYFGAVIEVCPPLPLE